MNDEPPVDSQNWLHHALIALDQLSHVPALALVILIALLAGAVGGLWHVTTQDLPYAVVSGAGYVLFAVADWAWVIQQAGLRKRTGRLRHNMSRRRRCHPRCPQ